MSRKSVSHHLIEIESLLVYQVTQGSPIDPNLLTRSIHRVMTGNGKLWLDMNNDPRLSTVRNIIRDVLFESTIEINVIYNPQSPGYDYSLAVRK